MSTWCLNPTKLNTHVPPPMRKSNMKRIFSVPFKYEGLTIRLSKR